MSLSRAQVSNAKPSVLVIYTGGTFGMQAVTKNPRTQETLGVAPMSADRLRENLFERVPEIRVLAHCEIDILFNRDSAHIGPDEWITLAKHIQSKWSRYDGIVILHGTDTLAYTASALSFLLRPCRKPIVLTGAQIPLSAYLSDARRNFISAIEIAAHGPRPLTQQVLVFFDDRLLQGNRTRKLSASSFGAFDSPYAEPVARVGTEIRYAELLRSSKKGKTLRLAPRFDSKVAFLQLVPGFPSSAFDESFLRRVRGLVLQGFPSGTAPTHDPDFLEFLTRARQARLPVILVSESDPAKYGAGRTLLEHGLTWAGRMTPECAYVKLALLLGQKDHGRREIQKLWKTSLAGEI